MEYRHLYAAQRVAFTATVITTTHLPELSAAERAPSGLPTSAMLGSALCIFRTLMGLLQAAYPTVTAATS